MSTTPRRSRPSAESLERAIAANTKPSPSTVGRLAAGP